MEFAFELLIMKNSQFAFPVLCVYLSPPSGNLPPSYGLHCVRRRSRYASFPTCPTFEVGCPAQDFILTHFTIVARIAYLSSDVVLSAQPALSADSEFSRHLHGLAAAKRPGLVAKKLPEVRHPGR
jgi:hypothetical protein